VSRVITRRRLGLAAVLAAAIAATGWVGGQEDPVELLRQPAVALTGSRADASRDPGHHEADAVDVEKLRQRVATGDFDDMFPRRSWQLPAVPTSASRREAPLPPPLPFVFFGRMVESGQTVVFLSRQNQSFAVKAGDTIDSAYRVDEIGTATIELTYLPLGQRQTLHMGIIN
jgi:hypothetical protein